MRDSACCCTIRTYISTENSRWFSSCVRIQSSPRNMKLLKWWAILWSWGTWTLMCLTWYMGLALLYVLATDVPIPNGCKIARKIVSVFMSILALGKLHGTYKLCGEFWIRTHDRNHREFSVEILLYLQLYNIMVTIRYTIRLEHT